MKIGPISSIGPILPWWESILQVTNLVARRDDHGESHARPDDVHVDHVLTHDDHRESLASKRDDPI